MGAAHRPRWQRIRHLGRCLVNSLPLCFLRRRVNALAWSEGIFGVVARSTTIIRSPCWIARTTSFCSYSPGQSAMLHLIWLSSLSGQSIVAHRLYLMLNNGEGDSREDHISPRPPQGGDKPAPIPCYDLIHTLRMVLVERMAPRLPPPPRAGASPARTLLRFDPGRENVFCPALICC